MFEKFSGFFKRFTRRQKKQSGETTIMDTKEAGLDDFGMDESFGDLSEIEQTIDKIGTAPVETGEDSFGGGASFPDADIDTGEFTTGGSDFDAQTISDERPGEASGGFEETLQEQEPGAFLEEIGGEPYEQLPGSASKGKRIAVLGAALIIAFGLGGAFEIFGWPYVSSMVGLGPKEPQVNVADKLNAATQKNKKLKAEVATFKSIGSPAEVKSLQQQIAQARDSQGPVEDLENKLTEEKERETAYDELAKKVNDLQNEIGKTRSEIGNVSGKIDDAKLKVVALKNQTEQEYARFQNELMRAEISQRTLIELQREDSEMLQKQIKDLEEYLSRLEAQQAPLTSSAGGTATEPTVGS